jgi:hypothetical protein
MKEKKTRSNDWKVVVKWLPLAGVAGSALLPLQRSGQQLAILLVLLWVQAFFIIECFFSHK